MTAAPGIVLSHFPANRGGNCAKDHGKRCGAATDRSAFGCLLTGGCEVALLKAFVPYIRLGVRVFHQGEDLL